jgi:hypothetical protein
MKLFHSKQISVEAEGNPEWRITAQGRMVVRFVAKIPEGIYLRPGDELNLDCTIKFEPDAVARL